MHVLKKKKHDMLNAKKIISGQYWSFAFQKQKKNTAHFFSRHLSTTARAPILCRHFHPTIAGQIKKMQPADAISRPYMMSNLARFLSLDDYISVTMAIQVPFKTAMKHTGKTYESVTIHSLVQIAHRQNWPTCATLAVVERHMYKYMPKDRGQALVYVCSVGETRVAEFLISKYKRPRCHFLTRAFNCASANGHLEIVQFLHSINVECSERAMHLSIEKRHLRIVQFLMSIGGRVEQYVYMSIVTGNLKNIEFLHMAGYNFHPFYLNMSVRYKRVDIIRFLHSIRVPFDDDTAKEAVMTGNAHIVHFMHSIGLKFGRDSMALDIEKGHSGVVKTLHAYTYTLIPKNKQTKHQNEIFFYVIHSLLCDFVLTAIACFVFKVMMS